MQPNTQKLNKVSYILSGPSDFPKPLVLRSPLCQILRCLVEYRASVCPCSKVPENLDSFVIVGMTAAR
jgi:hypothetical protein